MSFLIGRWRTSWTVCAVLEAEMPGRRAPLEVRFWRFVDQGGLDDCWEWQGAKSSKSYGLIKHHGKNLGAHRVSYEMYKGPIPKGKMVCHHCDNPPCINPAHLYAGTHKTNGQDMVRRGRHWGPKLTGEDNPNTTISDAIVEMARCDPRPSTVLAPILGVHLETLRNWRRGEGRSRMKKRQESCC